MQVGDTRLYFDVVGPALELAGPVVRERPTVVCLHGGPGLDHSVLRPTFDGLAEVAQVVYLDLRGHGRSDRSDRSKWTLAQWAEDVREFCSQLGIERPVVLGTSFGGYVAMAYAVAHPDQPGGLVLISTAARGTDNRERQGRVFAAFERLGGTQAREVAERAFAERSPEAFADYLAVCGPLYNRRPPDPDAQARTDHNHAILPVFEAPGGEGATFDFTDRLAEVRCPVLVVGGADDPITPLDEQRHIAAALPPGLVRLRCFPGCGHGVARDDAAALTAAVAEFLESR